MKEINQKLLDKIIKKQISVLGNDFESSIMIVRNDGVSLWSNDKNWKMEEKHSLGALVAGLWSSGSALVDTITSNGINSQLSMGNSSDGLYLLPISLEGRRYAFTILYKSSKNPSKLKFKFRLVKKLIEDSYFEESLENDKVEEGKNKTKMLFNNITDEEIDNLFLL